MNLPRDVRKRIEDRLERHDVVVITAKKGVYRVFSGEQYRAKIELAKTVQPSKYRKKNPPPDPLGAVEGRVLSSLSRDEIYRK
jgi:hypothetical protein